MPAVEIDPVPWAMGDEALNSEAAARLATYAATGGAAGVILPGDMKVTQLDVPGAGVKIAAGGALVRNRSQGAAAETYVTRILAPGDFGLSGTGSTGPRSDLIVSEVEDPTMSGGPAQSPADGFYHRINVITGVPAGTRFLRDVPNQDGRSVEELCRIDWPSATGTVLNAMIVDLRRVARPQSDPVFRSTPITGGQLTSSSETQWIQTTIDLPIPEYATHFEGVLQLHGIILRGGAQGSSHRLRLGANVYSASTTIDTGADLDTQRMDAGIGMNVAIPAAMRGTTQTLRVLSRRTAGTARLDLGFGVQGTWQGVFKQQLT